MKHFVSCRQTITFLKGFTPKLFHSTFIPSSNYKIYSPLRSPLYNSLISNNRFCISKVQAPHQNILKSSYKGQGFYIEQLFTGCLAIYSYYIESGDECFLIDPMIQTQKYSQLIDSRKKKLTGIFNTHYHADFVSGQYELQKKYQCKLYMGPGSKKSDKLTPLNDKQTIKLGQITLQCWHTPGHTQESSCLLLLNQKGKRDVLFSGDTVFLNEVGRPDLAVKTNLSEKKLASMLFKSIQKLKVLQNDIRIYPGHGSGSSCGKSIGQGDYCTFGIQKGNNYGLKIENEEEFIHKVLVDMPAPPKYFGYNAKLNMLEPFFYQQKSQKAFTKLSVDEVNNLRKEKDIYLLDIRDTQSLKKGIIKGSICIGVDGGFANWVGSLLNPNQRIIIIGNGNQQQAIKRLFRIGFINILGFNGFKVQDWAAKNFDITLPDFSNEIVIKDTVILDVRKPDEWKTDGKVQNSLQLELSDLFHHPDKLDKTKNYIIHCKSGYRAKIAWSYLNSLGFNVKAYPKSFNSIFELGLGKKTSYVG